MRPPEAVDGCFLAVPDGAGPFPGLVVIHAKHSFFNDRWRNYHPGAAADSWERVLAFFDTHVRRGAR